MAETDYNYFDDKINYIEWFKKFLLQILKILLKNIEISFCA